MSTPLPYIFFLVLQKINKMKEILVGGKKVRVKKVHDISFICLTDIVKGNAGRPLDYLKNYIKNQDNIEFLKVWETVNNPSFKGGHAATFKTEASLNRNIVSISKWMKATAASGFEIEKGKYGGTYAHEEIAIHFMNWFDASFYVYFIKKFKEMSNGELQFHIRKITDHIDEARNWLDTTPGQDPEMNRIKDSE
jgi:hypothetical protein